MTTIISGPVTKKEKKWIIDRIRRAFDPDTFVSRPPAGMPQLIAGAPPGDPLGNFQRRIGRRTCDRWAAGERDGILPFQDSYYRTLCTPYLGANMPRPSVIDPTFSGGQCAGVIYSVSGTFTISAHLCSNGNFVNTTRGNLASFVGVTLTGPVDSITIENFGTACRGIPTGVQCRIIDQGGARNRTFQLNPVQTTFNFQEMRIAPVLTRVDMLPDDCGNGVPTFTPAPPVAIPDPTPGPIGGPTGYPFPNLDVDINADGDIVINFGDGEPPVVFDPTAPGGFGGGSGRSPGDIGTPSTPADTGSGGESEDEAPGGSVLSALKINLLDVPLAAREYAPGIYRAVCYIYMGTIDGMDQDFAGSMCADGQIVFPELDNLTNWKVVANVGYNLRITPFYREAE